MRYFGQFAGTVYIAFRQVNFTVLKVLRTDYFGRLTGTTCNVLGSTDTPKNSQCYDEDHTFFHDNSPYLIMFRNNLH